MLLYNASDVAVMEMGRGGSGAEMPVLERGQCSPMVSPAGTAPFPPCSVVRVGLEDRWHTEHPCAIARCPLEGDHLFLIS